MHCQLTIIKLDEQQAVLINKEKQQFTWPANQLPPDSQVGTVLTCALVNANKLDQDDQALAKAILNELLKKSSS